MILKFFNSNKKNKILKILSRKNLLFNLPQRTVFNLSILNPIYKNSPNKKFPVVTQKLEKRFFKWNNNFVGLTTSCILAILSFTLTANCESDQFESNKRKFLFYKNMNF